MVEARQASQGAELAWSRNSSGAMERHGAVTHMANPALTSYAVASPSI
jgi:hypothetical protein